MPPHGGHRHGGGHHGGGHHHHGGGHRPGGWQGGWGPGWAYPGVWGAQPAYAELVVPSCPDVVDPVLASDGRTYINSCLANQAGARVVRHLGAQKLSGIADVMLPRNLLLAAGVGIIAYMMFVRKPTGRERSAAHVRTVLGRR